MPRWPVQHDAHGRPDGPSDDWDLSEGLDPEGPSASDLDRFGDELSRCPSCKEPIYDQAALCPYCGHAIEERPRSMSLWVVFGVCGLIVLLLVLVL